jgi:hypothetical protein
MNTLLPQIVVMRFAGLTVEEVAGVLGEPVTANRWQRVGDSYHEAAALSADERAAFLDAACGNDAGVRREVESLLAHAGDASGWINTILRSL